MSQLSYVLQLPFLLAALILESVANALRFIAWLFEFPPLSLKSKKRDEIEAPLGFWRCTYSSAPFDRSFVAGRVYKAIHLPVGTRTIRVIPEEYNFWAPYWDKFANRFCYPPDEIDFEYLGSDLPEGEVCRSNVKPAKRSELTSRLASY